MVWFSSYLNFAFNCWPFNKSWISCIWWILDIRKISWISTIKKFFPFGYAFICSVFCKINSIIKKICLSFDCLRTTGWIRKIILIKLFDKCLIDNLSNFDNIEFWKYDVIWLFVNSVNSWPLTKLNGWNLQNLIEFHWMVPKLKIYWM